jgi:hypothetical protein
MTLYMLALMTATIAALFYYLRSELLLTRIERMEDELDHAKLLARYYAERRQLLLRRAWMVRRGVGAVAVRVRHRQRRRLKPPAIVRYPEFAPDVNRRN